MHLGLPPNLGKITKNISESECVLDPLVEEFERNGYVVLSQVISQERIQEVRDRLLKVFSYRKEQGLNLNKGLRDVLFDAYVHYPDILDTFCNEKTMNALRRLLGDNFIVPPDSSVLREYYGNLHTDTTGNELHGWMFHKKSNFRIVTVGLYLQDQTEAYGGGLMVVPGSHKKADPYVKVVAKNTRLKKSKWLKKIKKWSGNRLLNYDEQLKTHPDGVDLPMKAGDCIIFDMRIIHRATHPASCEPAPDGGKLAIFSRCSARNPVAWSYLDYFFNVECNAPGYDYLLKPRDLAPLREMAQKFGFEAF